MSAGIRSAIYSTFNAAQFGRQLANDALPPALEIVALHELLPGAAFLRVGGLPPENVDVAVVVATPESVLPAVAGLLSGAACEPDVLTAEVFAFRDALRDLPARLVFVANWIAPPRFEGGLLALDERWGLSGALTSANAQLAAACKGSPALVVLNATGWQRILGERAFSSKGWFLTKDPYSFDVWKLAVAEIKAAILALSGRAKKLIILDLDNTLWGGEVGDAGVEGLRLGGHDAVGEAFLAFQRELLALARRGVVLAVASKNDEATALGAIDAHPEMAIRRSDLAGWAIDWEEKGPNIRSLCARLGISPSDAVFIDDNPVERNAARASLPDLTVPDWPANPLLFVDALRRIDLFDVPEVTHEDLTRGHSYAAARTAREYGAQVDPKTRIEVTAFDNADFPRVLQLLNKTNQMNLTTRRFSEGELRAWLARGEHAMWTVRVGDAFTEYGLVGVLMLDFVQSTCIVSDFVMSCRVISRGVEERMLEVALREAGAHHCARLEARFLPTERNEPMRRFLAERSGLRSNDGSIFASVLRDNATPATA